MKIYLSYNFYRARRTTWNFLLQTSRKHVKSKLKYFLLFLLFLSNICVRVMERSSWRSLRLLSMWLSQWVDSCTFYIGAWLFPEERWGNKTSCKWKQEQHKYRSKLLLFDLLQPFHIFYFLFVPFLKYTRPHSSKYTNIAWI